MHDDYIYIYRRFTSELNVCISIDFIYFVISGKLPARKLWGQESKYMKIACTYAEGYF